MIETMTPPGVEHLALMGHRVLLLDVIETMTPPGVEHFWADVEPSKGTE